MLGYPRGSGPLEVALYETASSESESDPDDIVDENGAGEFFWGCPILRHSVAKKTLHSALPPGGRRSGTQ